MSTADHLLLTQWFLQRDAQAFKTLTKRYCAIVYGTSMRILRSPADAEEITQECFAALATARSGPTGSLGAWLHRVATYKALNRRRSDQRRREHEEQFIRARAQITEAHWDDISQFIDQSIQALPDKLRTVIVAHFIEDESVTAIAESEGVTHGAISQRIQKAVMLIRERMKQNGIPISVAAMMAMLSQQASAWPPVPASLSAGLGKLALTGGVMGRAPAAAWLGAKQLMGAAATVALAGAIAIYAAFVQAEPVASAVVADVPDTVRAVIAPTPAATPAAETSPVSEAPIVATLAVEKPVTKEPATWREVVEAYTSNQDRIRRISFDYEHRTSGTYFFQSFAAQPGRNDFSERGSLVTDGTRIIQKRWNWGQHWAENYPAERAAFHIWVYNGDAHAQYDAGGGEFHGRPGMLQITPDAVNSPIQRSAFDYGRSCVFYGSYPGGDMLGYPLTAGLRMEEILQDARNIALRPAEETLGGEECYVVDADTPFGDFSVWFAPARGYNVAKSVIRMSEGDIFEKNPLEPTRSAYYEYVVSKFSEIDGNWVPIESNSHHVSNGLNNNGYDYNRTHKRSNIKLLGPDDDKDAYFVNGDEIPNGARLMGQIGEIRRSGDPEWFWMDGEFVLMTDEPGAKPIQRTGGSTGFGGGIMASDVSE